MEVKYVAMESEHLGPQNLSLVLIERWVFLSGVPTAHNYIHEPDNVAGTQMESCSLSPSQAVSYAIIKLFLCLIL